MFNSGALVESPDLAARLWFWLGDEIIDAPRARSSISDKGPSSWSGVADILAVNPEVSRMVAVIAEDFRRSVKMIVTEGPFDTPYYQKTEAGGLFFRFELEWRTSEDRVRDTTIFFNAHCESAAVLAMLRYVVAQQSAYPDIYSMLDRAVVKRVTMDLINEFGQIFNGEPNTVFLWDQSREPQFMDVGVVCLDAAVLTAAAMFASQVTEKA